MRDWQLTLQDPVSLILTADPRLSKLDKAGSDIWELSLGDISSPYLGLKTTYGLKAIGMRIFLGFSNASELVRDPAAFFEQPVLKNFSSNYARMTFKPFADLSASTEFWIVGSHLVCGRIAITNLGNEYRNINLLLSATLIPTTPGKPCTLMNQGLNTCLQGATGEIFPTLVMGGGPTGVASPYPALSLPLRLKPGEDRSISWACASENDPKLSLANAMASLKRDWEKELARLELVHDSTTVDIYSGDQDWDAVLAFSQQHAFSSLSFDDENLVNGFVPYLSTDHTYAQSSSWNNTHPSALLLNHLIGALLPGNPVIATQLVTAFLQQTSSVGSRSSLKNASLPFPIIADLVWNIIDLTGDQGLLGSLYPLLRELVLAWFDQDHDKDRDGVPEFQTVDQLCFYHPQINQQAIMPVFTPGVQFVENPGLAFLLIRELTALDHMAHKMGDEQAQVIFSKHIRQLSQQLRTMFHSKRHCFVYRDRDTHFSAAKISILHLESLTDQPVNVTLDPPQRIVVSLNGAQQKIPKISIKLMGVDQAGEEVSESVDFCQSYLPSSSLHLLSEQVFSELIRIETIGGDPSISLDLATMDLLTPDISCLLPLSCELISSTQLQSSLKAWFQAGNPRYQFGLPEVPRLPKSRSNDFPDLINLPWNFLLITNLLDNTLDSVAADLFSRLTTLIVSSLKRCHAFFEYFNVKDGSPMGHRHSLSGIVPVSLYLRMIGVRIISPTAVEISGECPFPGKITVKYRGMQIIREGKLTRVILPNGQVTRIYGSATHIVGQKKT